MSATTRTGQPEMKKIPTLKLDGNRVNTVIDAFNALPETHYQELLGNYFNPLALSPDQKNEIVKAIFGETASDARELFETKLEKDLSAAELMLLCQNFAIRTLTVGFQLPSDAPATDIFRNIAAIEKRYNFTNAAPDMLNQAYIALIYAAQYGSGLALKLLRDLQLLSDPDPLSKTKKLSDLTELLQLPISYEIQSMLFNALVLNNANPGNPDHDNVAAQQSLPNVSEHPAHWQHLRQSREGLVQYNSVKALLENVEAKIEAHLAATKAAPFNATQAYLQLPTKQQTINLDGIEDADVRDLITIRNQLLTNLISLAPIASDVMRAGVAQAKQNLANTKTAASALVEPPAPEGRKFLKDSGYTDHTITSVPFKKLTSEMQAQAKADHARALEAHQTAVTKAQQDQVQAQKIYDAAQAELDATDPRTVRVTKLLELMISDIERFSAQSKLSIEGTTYSIVAAIALCFEQDISATRDRNQSLDSALEQLPQGSRANNDYYAFYKLFYEAGSAQDFIRSLASKLYNNAKNSALKGRLSTNTTNEGTVDSALLHHPIIMAVLLIRSVNIDNVETHEADVARIKEQIRVFEQYFGSRLDTVSPLAIALRNELVLRAAVLLDQQAINTLRLEPSTNLLTLENVALDAKFHQAVRKVSFAKPSYEDSIAFYTELKEVLDANRHPFARVFREMILTLLMTYPQTATIAAVHEASTADQQAAGKELTKAEQKNIAALKENAEKLFAAQQAKMQDYATVNAQGTREISATVVNSTLVSSAPAPSVEQEASQQKNQSAMFMTRRKRSASLAEGTDPDINTVHAKLASAAPAVVAGGVADTSTAASLPNPPAPAKKVAAAASTASTVSAPVAEAPAAKADTKKKVTIPMGFAAKFAEDQAKKTAASSTNPPAPEKEVATAPSSASGVVPEAVAVAPAAKADAKDATPSDSNASDVKQAPPAMATMLGLIKARGKIEESTASSVVSETVAVADAKDATSSSANSTPAVKASAAMMNVFGDINARRKTEEQEEADAKTAAPVVAGTEVAVAAGPAKPAAKVVTASTASSVVPETVAVADAKDATSSSANSTPAVKAPTAMMNLFSAIHARRKSQVEEDQAEAAAKEAAATRTPNAEEAAAKEEADRLRDEAAANRMFGEGAKAFLARSAQIRGNTDENRDSIMSTRASEW